jgi:23S rRNA (uracil1939-C5)-methyltransferase
MTGESVESGADLELAVESIAAGGAGVARLPDGRAVFVHRTAPGDRIRARLTTEKKRWARARLIQLLEPGPFRREAPCPHYERCGGCTLEHLEYHAQLQAKGRIVTDALTRIGGLETLPRLELHPAPREIRYRNRVSFTLRRPDGERVVAGFHELDRPDRILDVDGRCLLPEEPVARAWDALREAWGPGARNLPAGRELRLTLRGTDRGEVILAVEGGEGDGDPGALLDRVPELRAVWAEGPEGFRLLAGESEVEETWYGEPFSVRPGAFLQVNRDAATHLHDLVLREAGVPRGRRIVDAYCGIGVYGRRLARHGGVAVGIEADPQAVEASRARPVEGFTLLEGRVENRLAQVLPADLLILNPPRAGVAQEVMELLAGDEAGPARIVYVSCDPATLARDVERLGQGYRITRLQVVDLFPQTAHVETVLTLDRVPGPVADRAPERERKGGYPEEAR